MVENEHWQTLRRLAETITAPEITPGNLFRATEELYRLLVSASGLEEQNPAALHHLWLPEGKALGPVWAARCLLDYQRTRAFLRGVFSAIEAARLRFPHTQIHVLYAGCGPFASLVLPLIPLLKRGSVAFTMLEVSPVSVEYLQKTVATFQISDWIRRIVVADATTYQCDPRQPVHIIIGEMLQAALQREPQVAATRQLAPQLMPGGFFIPEYITVQVGLLHPLRNQERMMSLETPDEAAFILLEPAFELSLGTAGNLQTNDFPEIEVEIPAGHDPGFRQIALFTHIQVFAEETIAMWESSLTEPLVIMPQTLENPVERIGFRYQTGNDPGFLCRAMD